MALIVEDGSLVAGAMSYITVSEVRLYAAARGKDLPEDETELEQLIVRATDFVDSYGAFKGTKVAATQGLEWPRVGVWTAGHYLEDDYVPDKIKRAVCEATILAQEVDFFEPLLEPDIVSETIGPLNTQYATSSSNPWNGPEYPMIDKLLAPFLNAGDWSLTALRI